MRKPDEELNTLAALEEAKKMYLENSNQNVIKPISGAAQLLSNTAYELAREQERVNKALQEVAEYNARKDAAVFQTAKESVAHTELLKDQLQKAKERNEMLQKNYSELEKINTQLNEESEANALAAKKARKLNIAAFVLSIILPLASIGASVLIALFI